MTSNDPMAPRSSGDDAFAGPLACITLVTGDADATDRFYGGVLGMSKDASGAATVPAVARELWGLPRNFEWQEIVYHRSGMPDVPRLRVLATDHEVAPVRPGLETRLEGGLSVGFVMRGIQGVVDDGLRHGFETTAGVGALDMQRADGSPYQVFECHFRAPDDVYALGVERPPDLAAIGPIADGAPVGGPSYTGQVMNHSAATMRFYTEVLGYEVRRSVPVSGPLVERGLGLPAGTSFQFMQVFAPGSTTGYFIVLDFDDDGIANSNIAPPHRGVVMWTFPVRDVDTVAERAPRFGCTVQCGPIDIERSAFGAHRALTVRTANGFLAECIETAA